MTSPDSWTALLSAFRALGGVAHNLTLGDGSHGRALVPVDSQQPVRLFVPAPMLVPTTETELDSDGDLVVRPESALPQPLQRFFADYQRTVGWSAGGRTATQQERAWIHALPAPLRETLTGEAHLGWMFEPEDEQALLQRFIHARHIDWNGRPVFMPMMDLVNHDWRAKNYGFGADGLTIEGTFPEGEVLVCYNLLDPWQRFIRYGFVSEERHAFSIPLAVRTPQGTLTVGAEPGQSRTRAGLLFPNVRRSGADITLTHLMLGDRLEPEAPKSIFLALAREGQIAQPILLFERIAHINRLFFLKLLRLAEGGGEATERFRTLLRLQLEALSHSVGAREIA
ncbi:MAG: hypothetical protein U1E46_09390 [Hyphomicrobiales bacterium]